MRRLVGVLAALSWYNTKSHVLAHILQQDIKVVFLLTFALRFIWW